MLAEVSQDVVYWIETVCPDIRATVGLPVHPAASEPEVRVTLLDITPAKERLATALARSHVTARYLLTVVGPSAEAAQNVFGQVLTAAIGRAECDVMLAPTDPSLWLAFQVPPQPSICLEIPVTLPRPQEAPVFVTQPPEIRMRPLGPLSGRLLGPGGKGIAGARIRVDGSDHYTRTDAQGGFTLNGVPLDGGPLALQIASGSGRMTVSVVPGSEPVIIEYQPERA